MINTARCIRNLGCIKKEGEEFKVQFRVANNEDLFTNDQYCSLYKKFRMYKEKR